jgi:4-diphosphocytidyl-2-C-methyl-D-erythritol kinase
METAVEVCFWAFLMPVTAPLTDLAPAKINLTLRVIGRRADGYHELESLVAFADIADELTLEPGAETGLDVTGPFAGACGTIDNNLVLKAAAKLAARVPGLRTGRFTLQKNLPVAAGIGGGSSDAAAALRLLARANGIAADDARLADTALSVGADVPVCLDPRPRIMRGMGEVLSEPLDTSSLPALLVNPRVATATKDVFAAFAGMHGSAEPLGTPPRSDLIAYLEKHGNDLTAAAIACVPVIDDVLDSLGALPGVRLARMSGSGSTCFALFDSTDAGQAAANRMMHARPNWWVAAATLGAVHVQA